MLNKRMDISFLFLSSLLAATIVPAQSEAVLAGLYGMGQYHAVLLIMTATMGNVLGSCINWWLGRYLLQFQERRWFPVTADSLGRATAIYQRFGIWTLLLAWVPFIGDPLTVVAGFLRVPFSLFVALVALGKLSRYIAVVLFIPV